MLRTRPVSWFHRSLGSLAFCRRCGVNHVDQERPDSSNDQHRHRKRVSDRPVMRNRAHRREHEDQRQRQPAIVDEETEHALRRIAR